MLVQNIGPEPYLLPVGRDPDVALQATNHGRREFWFDLKIAGERYSYLIGQETYGSTDLPDTMMTIPSKGVVRVRFKIDMATGVRNAPNSSRHEGITEVSVLGANGSGESLGGTSFGVCLRLPTRFGQAGEDRGPGRAKRVYRQSLDAVRSPAAGRIWQAKGDLVAADATPPPREPAAPVVDSPASCADERCCNADATFQ
jgi:hypothetical protein